MSKMHVKAKNVFTAIKQFVWKQPLYLATHKLCANVHSIEDLLPWYFTKGCAITRNMFNAQNKDLSIKQCRLIIHYSLFYYKHVIPTVESIWVSG